MEERIVTDVHICGGQPIIRGTRIPVHIILSHLAAGDDTETILENFPSLSREDIAAVEKGGLHAK